MPRSRSKSVPLCYTLQVTRFAFILTVVTIFITMVITYQGVEFFKVQFGETIIALGPISKQSKFKGPRFGADIAVVSTNQEDLNGVDAVTLGERQPFVVSGPGEYEIKGVFIRGFASETNYGGEKRVNTVYLITLEGMNLCYLGASSAKDLQGDAKEGIDDVDILFVPIGGDGVLSPSEAYKLAVSLEPKIIIPMHFGSVGSPKALAAFLKEGGEEAPRPVDKLTLKKKDLEGKEGDIVVLSSS